ncbi:MAG: 1-acyl-sn-glycerol-3-phosphate acyltransferase [Gammaproteobacteria bacterium]|nr:MAG: 1-acyl-sn-glycerol-3-phosphate acyltransferase [Gammaproteobacteria bacterium]
MRRLTVLLLGPLLLLLGLLLSLLLLPAGPLHRHRAGSRLIRWWLGRIARLFGVRTEIRGRPAPAPVLFVANHVSWLDIPVLGGLVEASFLSKDEIRRWPLIGFLAARAGTLFIARGRPGASEAALQTLRDCLDSGRSVILFPEARTSPGTGVRRFHGRLLQAAIDCRVPVQPVALQYLHAGRPDPLVPFVDTSFLQSVLRVTRRRHVQARVTFFPPLDPQGHRRDELAAEARRRVASVFDPAWSTGHASAPARREGRFSRVATPAR